MKVNEELSILFWLKREKALKDGRVPIYIRITVNGGRDGFASGKKIHPDAWDEKAAIAGMNCPEYQAINSYVTKTKAELEKCYNVLEATCDRVTATMVKDAYKPKPVVDQQSLGAAFKLHNGEFAEKVAKKKASPGTLTRYERLERYCMAFLNTKYKLRDMALEELHMGIATNFYHHLLLQDIGENAAMKYVKTLKQVIDRAINEGWIKVNPIKGFKCKYEDPDRECLEMHEVIKMYQKKIEIARLAEIRDVYVFCCFTGYAYETCYHLAPENIFTGLDGKLWITKDRQKTGSEECVPLMPIALEIIKRYKKHTYCLENNRLLPVNSNYRYNTYLKELADICGIKKHLTTHTARHTFATSVTLENDVPLETVGKMLGHKDIRSTQIYAKITKRKISNNMKELEGKLFTPTGKLKKAS
jgi:site-specific recombinase XerD